MLLLGGAARAERTPLVHFRWDDAGKSCAARFNEGWAFALKVPAVDFSLTSLCLYDASTGSWKPAVGFQPTQARAATVRRKIYDGTKDPQLGAIAAGGLYWARWKENGEARESFAQCYQVLCNDVQLGPAPSGKVAVCLPGGHAGYVPDPGTACPAHLAK